MTKGLPGLISLALSTNMRLMIFLKTELGQQAFKARSPLISARQRSMFILFDGIKSHAQVLASTAGMGVTQGDIDHLVQQGFLMAEEGASAVPAAAGQTTALPPRSNQERYSAAMPLATQLTASMGLRGFRLNLAVEGASGFDELLALLPKIQDAVGAKSCTGLERALKG